MTPESEPSRARLSPDVSRHGTIQMRCMDCRKIAYPHKEAATNAASDYGNSEAYEGRCGWWHLSTRGRA